MASDSDFQTDALREKLRIAENTALIAESQLEETKACYKVLRLKLSELNKQKLAENRVNVTRAQEAEQKAQKLQHENEKLQLENDELRAELCHEVPRSNVPQQSVEKSGEWVPLPEGRADGRPTRLFDTDDGGLQTSAPAGGMEKAVSALAGAMAQMAEASTSKTEREALDGDKHSRLLEVLVESNREQSRKIPVALPTVQAADAATLRMELKLLTRYFNETGVKGHKAFYRTMRAIAKGNAATQIEYSIIHSFGSEAGYQEALLRTNEAVWADEWNKLITRLKQNVSLDSSSDMHLAIQQFEMVKLEGLAVGDAHKFVLEYLAARTGMLENGLHSDSDLTMVRREREEFLLKIRGSPLMTYLLSLEAMPKDMDSDRPEDCHLTILGRCRQYVHAHAQERMYEPEFEDEVVDDTRDDHPNEVVTLLVNNTEAVDEEAIDEVEAEGPAEDMCSACWGQCNGDEQWSTSMLLEYCCPTHVAEEESHQNGDFGEIDWDLECKFEYEGDDGDVYCCGGYGHNVGHHIRALTPESRVLNFEARATPEQRAQMHEALLVLDCEVQGSPDDSLPEDEPYEDDEQEDYCFDGFDESAGQESFLTFDASQPRRDPESEFSWKNGVGFVDDFPKSGNGSLSRGQVRAPVNLSGSEPHKGVPLGYPSIGTTHRSLAATDHLDWHVAKGSDGGLAPHKWVPLGYPRMGTSLPPTT